MLPRRPITSKAALARAVELCNKAEHCSGEIRRKLSAWGITPADADSIIARLEATRLIDDARFARLFVRDKVEYAGWGRRKIAAALRLKHIDAAIADAALDTIDEDVYTERLRGILLRKLHSVSDADTYEGRTRVFRYAVARGFEPSLAASVLRTILTSATD